MAERNILLRAQGVTKSFQDGEGDLREVLSDLDIEIRSQSLTVIRGESGCGKSTLLRILGLVDPEFQGSLEICGEIVSSDEWSTVAKESFRARHIGFVFQDDLLLPLLTLQENSELPARIHRLSKETVGGSLKGLQDLIFRPTELKEGVLNRFRTTVSGGQRQRAAVLRALSHGPDLILADEPTASLDPSAKRDVVRLFRRLCQQGHTILVASHDEIFRDVGETYQLTQGKLRKVESKDSLLQNTTEKPRSIQRPSRPRGCPPGLQAKIAFREARGNPLFALMIIAAMVAGLFQLTLLFSIRSGTEKVLDEVINKGSRLDRVVVAARAQVEETAEVTESKAGVLPSEEILEQLGTIRRTVPRREIVLRVNDSRGRERQETVFGLVPDDPEVQKLELREGQPFVDQQALSVLITERSVDRYFGAEAVGRPVVGNRLALRFRRYLSADEGPDTISLPTEGEMRMEQVEFECVVQGVLARAEAGRNLYLPQGTLLAIATWKMNPEAVLKVDGNRLDLVSLEAGREKPPWERLHVYFDRLEDVLPAAAYFERQGFTSKADLFRYRWVLDTRRFVSWMLGGVTVMVMGIAGLLLMSNVVSGVRLKRKEIAVLKLMGMKDRDVVAIFVLSVLLCALLGGSLGFAMGSFTVDQIQSYLGSTYPDSPLGQVLTPTWERFGHALLLSSIVTVLFTVFPAWQTARKEAVWRID